MEHKNPGGLGRVLAALERKLLTENTECEKINFPVSSRSKQKFKEHWKKKMLVFGLKDLNYENAKIYWWVLESIEGTQ